MDKTQTAQERLDVMAKAYDMEAERLNISVRKNTLRSMKRKIFLRKITRIFRTIKLRKRARRDVETLLRSDDFWVELIKEENGGVYDPEVIFRRQGLSEEQIRKAKEISNRNRIKKGKKPLFPDEDKA